MAEEQAHRGADGGTRERRSERSRRGRRRARKRQREQRAAAARKAAAQPTPSADVEAADKARPSARARAASRVERRRDQRRERRRGRTRAAGRGLVVGMLFVAAIGAGVGVRLATTGQDGPEAAGEVAAGDGLPDGVDPQPTILLVTAGEDADPRVAESLVVLSHDRRTGKSTILLIPATTVADIPGHGVLPLADALRFGGPALVAASVDNLLGVHLDGVADLGYRDWAALFSRVGPVQVDLDRRLVVEGGDVRFLAGRQDVAPDQAAELLALQAPDERELDRLPRLQRVLLAHLGAMAADPALLDAVVADGMPMIDSELPTEELSALVTALANAVAADTLDVLVLPVRPLGGGAGEEGYRPDAARVQALVADRFASSVPDVAREGRALQVLNGNGTPGIGQSVAEQLVPAGFRVVLTGNADDFEHARTRIVIYDDTPEQVAIANEIRERLGVGVVEISRTPQSVVDVTIVVGRDYPPRRG